MSQDLRKIGDACWTSYNSGDWSRAIGGSQAVKVAEDIVYIPTTGVVGNVTAVRTSEGLVVFDTGGSSASAEQIYKELRSWDPSPIHTIIFTHGHRDHVMGAAFFEAEAKKRGEPTIRFIAQRNMPARFARYTVAAKFIDTVTSKQFGVAITNRSTEFPKPDVLYDDSLSITVGGVTFELNHGMGETDDHTWTWIPHRKVVISGDFIIWAAPNSGNPQKVQRYTKPWADAFRVMATKKADTLIPGHGPAVFGADRVATLLADGAAFLDTMHDQVLALMNDGKTLDEIVQAVKFPTDLLSRPYLQPTYDDPEFLIRNIWRLYGGWWDGNPAHLKPAPAAALGAELARLAGGAAKLVARARELALSGELRLAGHLVEFAASAEPGNIDAHEARRAINQLRSDQETSQMGRGIFGAAARESQLVVNPSAPPSPRNLVGIG